MTKTTTAHDRFWAKVEKADGCWLWLGAKQATGYGNFKVRSYTTVLAHRFAWADSRGLDVPAGYEVDHLCKNTSCVRPDHLEAVPPRVNWERSDSPTTRNAAKVLCKRGHIIDYVTPSTGHRKCTTCSRTIHEPNRKRRRAGLDPVT